MRRKRGVLGSRTLLDSIEPIGHLSNGTPLYPIAGSTGPEDEGDDELDEEEEEEEEEGDDEEKSKKDDSKEKPKRRKPASKETPEQKVRRLNAENKARREELEAAQAKLKEIEDKDKSELELAIRDRDEATSKVESLEEKVQEQGFELAFLRHSVEKGYVWDDAEYVMHKLRKQGLEWSDGEVEDLEDAVSELVKNKPSLLRSVDDEDEVPSSRTTGAHPRTSRKKKVNSAQKQAELAHKYGMANMVPLT